MLRRTLVLIASLASLVIASPASNAGTLVKLRIEGDTRTIFEQVVFTRGHDVDPPSGGKHHCDGTNLNANPIPGPTVTSALDDASKKNHFFWDGTYFAEFDDYLITNIAGVVQTNTTFWRILLDFKYIDVGGCQQQVKFLDEVLFAFGSSFDDIPLKLSGPTGATVGQPVTLTVTDGATGAPVAGATVAGQTSDANGNVVLTFTSSGVKNLKAERANSIRSDNHQVNIK